MPYTEGRIFVCLCPFVNLDLFKRGHYHISCKLSDKSLVADVVPLSIKDFFVGEGLSEHTFPGACILEDGFITQTVLMEYTEQSFMFGEYFLFKQTTPILTDYNEPYMPAQLSLTLDLMFCGDEDLPTDPTLFERVSTRTVSLTVDWRKGLHQHWPVLFDYFHMAAIGVSVHASLYKISHEMYEWPSEKNVIPPSRWSFQSSVPIPTQIGYPELLFGTNPSQGKRPEDNYVVPTQLISRAQHVHQMLTDIMLSARDNLRLGFQVMSGDWNDSCATANGPLSEGTTLDEVEDECRIHLEALSMQLQATWEWFCRSAVVHPDMLTYLASQSHSIRLQILRKTFICPCNKLILQPVDYGNLQWVENIALGAKKLLNIPPLMYGLENLENSSNSCVILVDPCPWETRHQIALSPESIETFQSKLTPYLLSSFPSVRRPRRSGSTHLIVCVHGLQGNQFDLRLYRSFLELALPYQRLEFLMAQSNQSDTFVDFNVMTDRLEEEIQEKIRVMSTLPTRVSFLAHSLGSILVRSLVTRPSMANLIPKFHLLLSICGPHLGTQHQTGVVSAGMWFVRKWYHSQSLLQLSLKDSPTPRDCFLYHLSEAQTLDCFKHVVLLTSLQDRYVPHQSARLCPGGEDTSQMGKVIEEMASNILNSMEQSGTNLVRVIVHHSLPTSTDSVIGRAAHVAMLDNELFVEKFILCHLVQYFINT